MEIVPSENLIFFAAPLPHTWERDGDSVPRVVDLSGLRNDASEATNPPSIAVGALGVFPALDFDGTEKLAAGTAFTETALSIYIVIEFDAADPYATAINFLSTRQGNLDGGFIFDTGGTGNLTLRVFTGSSQPTSTINKSTVDVTGGYHLIEGHIGGGEFFLVVDGVDAAAPTSGIMAASTTPLTLGSRTGSSGGIDLDGKIALVAVYGAKHLSAEAAAVRARINGFLGVY